MGILILFLITQFCETGYKVRISLITTSDWTNVFFNNAKLDILHEEVREKGSLIKFSFFKIQKAMDLSKTIIEYDAILVPEDNAQVIIVKGDTGETTIEISRNEEVIFKFRNASNIQGDITNKMVFDIPKGGFNKCEEEEIKISPPNIPKMVLAFYYPWFRTQSCSGIWEHWNPQKPPTSPRTPSLGYYDSGDTAIIRKHIEMAKKSGLDGFIVSWWGIGSYTDEVISKLLNIMDDAEFKLTIYYELAESTSDIIRDIKYICSRYGSKKSFLTIDDKPVIFYYSRVVDGFSLKEWEGIFGSLRDEGIKTYNIADSFDPIYLNMFDGIHIYLPAFEDKEYLIFLYRSFALSTSQREKLFVAVVAPGFDNTFLWTTGAKRDRENGEYYKSLWTLAIQSSPTWVIITSFNEWQEGSEIEPSIEFGDMYLQITKKYANKFKKQ